jgi:hypothetical protein
MVAGSSLTVTAWVSMMCSCKIDPTLPCLPTQFAVTASVADASGTQVAQTALAFQTTSTFGTASRSRSPTSARTRLP